jgi:hypothetical protein
MGVRITRAERRLTNRWREIQIKPRRSTLLGISFRPLQVEAMGLDLQATLLALLRHPFQLVRLGAYWNRIESQPRRFDADELDWQIDAAEAAGKQIILCVGPVKSFGYPEFFVPSHHLREPLREGSLVDGAGQRSLLAAATEFVERVVERYKDRSAVVAWQVEHEAVDPLGMEHSWRLSSAFVQTEVGAARKADPTRPIMMNGFLPASLPVRLQQWWRTRDQGDSLAVAQRLADIVGIDYYPRHALIGIGSRTIYMNGSQSPRLQRRRMGQLAALSAGGRKLMISEGQAEPWEADTIPPNPPGLQMYSCTPEDMIENYNRCLSWAEPPAVPLYAYLFWGAEYWVLRDQSHDSRYLEAFARIVENA